jgi:transposase
MIVWEDCVMAKGYRPVERDQVFLFPPSMRDWLSADHPVWLVIRAVQVMDTGPFHDLRSTGGAGTAGYDPDMLVTVLTWAYAHQVTSSRRIEQLCHTDVAFRVICGGNLPDHTTIARFRAAFPGVIAVLFAEVLGLCAQLGMGKVGVVALDGTKIAASASKSANRAEDTLRKMAEETVARHGRTDAAEDEMFGEGRRGDEVPEDAWSPRSRDERIAAALDSLRREREATEAVRQQQAAEYLDKTAAGRRPPGNTPAGAQVAAARMRLEQAIAAQQNKIEAWERAQAAKLAATGTGQRAHRPVPVSEHFAVVRAAAALEKAQARDAAAASKDNDRGRAPVRNVTDPDSRLMPVRGGGFIQGYNAQLVTSEDGLIIAATLTQDTGDVTWLKPMMAAAGKGAALIAARAPASPDTGSSDASTGDGGEGDTGDGGSSGGWRAAGYQPPAGDGQDGCTGPIGLLLADAGYCSEDNITAPGPPRLIATGKRRDLEKKARGGDGAGPARDGPHTAAMAAVLATSDGITAYRHRGHIAETPNGDIKHNKGFRQFSVRGLAKTSSELTFTAATTNLVKAIVTGHLTHAALDHLTRQASGLASPA